MSIISEWMVVLGYQVDAASEQRLTDSMARQARRLDRLQEIEQHHGRAARQAFEQGTRDFERAERERIRAAERAERAHIASAERVGQGIGNNIGRIVARMIYAASTIGGLYFSIRGLTGLVTSLDELDKISQRTGASVSNIRAFEFAIKMLGGTSGDAVGAIDSLSDAMRANRGVGGMLRGLGVTETKDSVEMLRQLAPRLRAMNSDVAIATGGALGLSPQVIRMIRDGSLERYLDHATAKMKEWGIDQGQASKSARELSDTWTGIGLTFEMFKVKMSESFMKPGIQFSQRLDDILKRMGPRLGEGIGNFLTNAATWLDKKSEGFLATLNDKDTMDRIEAWFNRVSAAASKLAADISTIASVLVGAAKLLGIPFVAGQYARKATDDLGITSGGSLSRKEEEEAKAEGKELPSPGIGNVIGGAWDWLFGKGAASRDLPGSLFVSPAQAATPSKPATDKADRKTDEFGEHIDKFGRIVSEQEKKDLLAKGGAGGVGGAGPSGTGSGVVSDDRTWWQKVAPKALGGRDAPSTGTPQIGEQKGAVGSWWTPERRQQAIDHLKKNAGLSDVGAQALVARWSGVEAGAGPGAVNPRSGAAGIAQWLGDRKRSGVPESFEGQLDKATQELNTTEKRAGDMLRNAKTPLEAAIGASQFERAEGYNSKTGADAFVGKTLGVMRSMGVGMGTADTAAGTKTSEFVNELQGRLARHRRQPITEQLRGVLDSAGRSTGLIADVTSGGQHAHEQFGSTRHNIDSGEMGAADLKLRDAKTGEIMSLSDPAHRERIAKYVSAARAGGATGFGAGQGYMGDKTLHIGGGKEAVWGGEEGFLRKAMNMPAPEKSRFDTVMDTIRNTASKAIDTSAKAATDMKANVDPQRWDMIKKSGFDAPVGPRDFAGDRGRYLGPSMNTNNTSDNSKKIDFDQTFHTTISASDPKTAATSFQRAHEQLGSHAQVSLQGMIR